jgi:hypothetical protein
MPYFVFFLSLFCSGGLSEAAFSNMGIAARSLGMGGAFTAVADDASATLWNPAGLVQLGHFELSSMYLNYPVPNVSTQFISAATPLLWDSSLGLVYCLPVKRDFTRNKPLPFPMDRICITLSRCCR